MAEQADDATGDLTGPSPAPAGADEPARVGPFVIDAVLGRGGGGVVFRAHDPASGIVRALKALPEALSGDPARRQLLEREAALLALVNHPNVAALHGIEEDATGLYLVLELVEGESLRDRLDRGPVPLGEALGIALQVADGLEAAHERRIVHRDLKPANVQLRPDGVVKLLDLGIAARLGPDPAGHDPGGAVVGTPAYMSPEQLAGAEPDPRTDLWALGCLLFELLVGQHLWLGQERVELAAAIREAPAELERLPLATPRRLVALIAGCLEKSPSKRPASMAAARAEIEILLETLGAPLQRVFAPPRSPATCRGA